MWYPSTCDCKFNKKYKLDEYLDIKQCSCKKCLVIKLVLAREEKILNTTGVGYRKVTCPVVTIALFIIEK